MNDNATGHAKKKSGLSLVWIGLALVAFPLVCLFIIVASFGVTLKGGLDSVIFWSASVGALVGLIMVPVGLVVVIMGIVRMMQRD